MAWMESLTCTIDDTHGTERINRDAGHFDLALYWATCRNRVSRVFFWLYPLLWFDTVYLSRCGIKKNQVPELRKQTDRSSDDFCGRSR